MQRNLMSVFEQQHASDHFVNSSRLIVTRFVTRFSALTKHLSSPTGSQKLLLQWVNRVNRCDISSLRADWADIGPARHQTKWRRRGELHLLCGWVWRRSRMLLRSQLRRSRQRMRRRESESSVAQLPGSTVSWQRDRGRCCFPSGHSFTSLYGDTHLCLHLLV